MSGSATLRSGGDEEAEEPENRSCMIFPDGKQFCPPPFRPAATYKRVIEVTIPDSNEKDVAEEDIAEQPENRSCMITQDGRSYCATCIEGRNVCDGPLKRMNG